MSDDTLASAHSGKSESTGDEAYCPACGQSFPMDTPRCPNDKARLVKLKAQVDPMLGRILDERYEVRAALGEGGMGTVYRGWQLSVDREVAIKVIHAKLASDRIAVKRFLREARLSSRLSQPSIVNVYDFGQSEDGTLFLVMELLRGQTLATLVEPMRPVPLKRVVTMALQLCDALESAHGQGIIHRDLKPGNIIILDDPPGRDLVKVLDFGLAKSLLTETTSVVTHSNALLGTPLYMPPEQIDGRPTDQTSDFYSFGCILYQMITGRPPYFADSVNLVLASHLHDPIPPLPPHIPAPIAQMITWMMAKDPASRVASARLVRDAFEAAVAAGLPPEPVMPDLSMEHMKANASGFASTHAGYPGSAAQGSAIMALGSASPISGAVARTMAGPGVSGNMRVSAMQPAASAALPRANTAGAAPGVAASAPGHTMFGALMRRNSAGKRTRVMALAIGGGLLAAIVVMVLAFRGSDDPIAPKAEPTAPAAKSEAAGGPTVTPIVEPTPTPVTAKPPEEPKEPVEQTTPKKARVRHVAKDAKDPKAEPAIVADKPEKPVADKLVDKKVVVDPFADAKKTEKTPERIEKPETKPTKGAPSIDFYKKK